ncbi:MAG TPA: hypothetical protein VNB49_15480 [Candidatus Dormibacteraeota bacterium]|nr:hypothetical protein [Candidatus Dormibacteraeota bacterium]
MARPAPIDEREAGSGGNDEKFAAVHACDEHSSKKKGERGEESSTWEAESICIRMFLAQNGQGPQRLQP